MRRVVGVCAEGMAPIREERDCGVVPRTVRRSEWFLLLRPTPGMIVSFLARRSCGECADLHFGIAYRLHVHRYNF